ncbi:hypothetical protein [Pseudoteredinibacter isoporae]|uniref:DUF3649 domain-containing protein n=1 Tax=Pseudoteredinibacter isoporae TaxID=570281 RepID=A0A7X0MYY7_9GAMM|nr:hypothetical protein [Pseudoteredinibacter isoporae]MBB6523579.1 hypothetical protein [Pseudoteredinibacter isoporae]NHO89087.1 hypothetical protein [Pseudoteredinibacter isoporae]NIB22302.1 hypothetical protein [Pseudoteredinibacter isoporae]
MTRFLNYFRSYNGQVLLRLFAAILLGYVASNAISVVFAKLLHVAAGLALSEAALYASLSGFLIYSLIILWVFSVRSQKKLWLQLSAVTVVCACLAWLL